MTGADKLDWIFDDSGDSLEARYDAWASTYDDDHDAWGWRGPHAVAAEMMRRLDAIPGAPTGAVLDAGCGTGKAGVALRELGWTGELIGLDLSQGMLDIAATSDAYNTLVKCSLDEVPLPDNAAIGVVSSGVFTHGHVGAEAFTELCRLTAPPGTIVVTQRLDLTDHFAPAADQLASEGAWVETWRSEPTLMHPDRDATEQFVVSWTVLR